MTDIDKLSDAELRSKLIEYGYAVPVTGSTRKLLVKKLKLLMESRKKPAAQDRRSLAKYSSEEESDSELRTRKDKNRRATMATTMQPPSSNRLSLRRSTRKNDSDNESEASTVSREVKTVITSSRSSKIVKAAQDDFDTGSESESDLQKAGYGRSSSSNNSQEFNRGSPESKKHSPPKTYGTNISQNTSYTSSASPYRYSTYNSQSSVDAGERLNQIRSRLSLGNSNYDRPSYTSPYQSKSPETGDTPFLSNFTRRLSQLSTANSPKGDYDFKNDVIKEHDTNGASSYARSYLSRPLQRRDYNRDFKAHQASNLLKNNLVSFTVLGVALLFFVIIGVMYLGMRSDTALDTSGYIIPYCVASDPKFKRGINCLLDSDIVGAVNILKVIKPELLKKSVASKCEDSAIKSYMTEKDIVSHVKTYYALTDEREILKDIFNLEVLIFKNPSWGISLIGIDEDKGSSFDNTLENMDEVIFDRDTKNIAMAVLHPDLPWKCIIYNKLYTIFNVTIFAASFLAFLYFSNYGYRYFKYYQQKKKDEVFLMVERIVDILQTNATDDGDNFLVINHVRDMILPISNRKKMEATWTQAVKFINENESRVRTEVQVVQGEPYEVWRWLGSTNLNTSGSPRPKTWQGQAFETQVGSFNSPPWSLTPCLKIRGMVDDNDRNYHSIREAVLSKCAHQCRILHCAVDASSKCVYLKCADEKDANTAYRNLHGWWYAGHLVTVKYLRLERYMQRFPDSPVTGPPFLKAVTPATD